MHYIAGLVPWRILDKLGAARIPKFFYDHNWWPLRGWKERDEQQNVRGPNLINDPHYTHTDGWDLGRTPRN